MDELQARSAPEGDRARGRRGAEHWVVLALVLAAFLVEIWLGVNATPDARGYGTHEQLGLAPCRAIDWFGVPCPGCGVTTSVAHAARFDLAQSFLVQPFGLFVAAVIPLAALWALVLSWRGGDCAATLSRLSTRWLLCSVGALALFGWIWKWSRL